jgi:signal transduction histidine kinase
MRSNRIVRRTIVGLVVTAFVAFTVVATGASIVSGKIARNAAISEAVHNARVVGNAVFVPLLPGAMHGEADAIRRMDNAVRSRSRDGSLVRVKVWDRTGTVIYSDEHEAIGETFPLHADVVDAIDADKDTATVSELNDPENVTETAAYDRLLEVYIPLILDDGTHVAFETYSTVDRIHSAERQLRSELIPFALLALLILIIMQLPMSVWLVRRVGRAQDEKSRLLNDALTASGRERRAIARDLHDGVVQDLAGASYAIGAIASALHPDTDEESRELVHSVGGVVQQSVDSLRTLMVDIYPPDLTADGLESAMEDLADKLRANAGIEVASTVDLETEPSPEVAATVYRCARECLANVAVHARANHAYLSLTGDATMIRLLLRDDGIGMPENRINHRANGHLGLQLLFDAAKDLGGVMRVSSAQTGGTTVVLELPTGGTGQVGAT